MNVHPFFNAIFIFGQLVQEYSPTFCLAEALTKDFDLKEIGQKFCKMGS
jgi:hypothetical protein